MPQWTTITPDGRRVIVKRSHDGWTVACGDSESAPRERLDVAVIEAILMDHDFALHSMRFDYAAWTCHLADQIEREERRPDDDQPGEAATER